MYKIKLRKNDNIEELINKLKENTKIIIKTEEYTVKTKTWYSIKEDELTYYQINEI